jgi:thiosulfate dehydrogenase [quinone] large subunit
MKQKTAQTITPKNIPLNKSISFRRDLIPLRLFLGITFVYAGIQKLTDPQFFNPSAPGYIGKQIIGFAHGSPLHDLFIGLLASHALAAGLLVINGEIAIGLGALFGLLLRPAAFFGLLLSLVFFFSASWHVFPYFYGADIVFVFCWLTLLLAGPLNCGYPTIDSALTVSLMKAAPIRRHRRLATLLSILLGIPRPPARSRKPILKEGSTQQQINNVGELSSSRRRALRTLAFLPLTLFGFAGIWSIFSAFRDHTPDEVQVLPTPTLQPTQEAGEGTRRHRDDNEQGRSATPNPGGQSTPQAGSPAATSGQAAVIARTSAVPLNSAVPFTLPTNSDDGILIHLSDGKFVAFDALCTHAGCTVDYDQGTQHLICPCHGAEFDPAHAAAVLSGPTDTPLPPVAIQIDSTGAITVKPST